MNGSSNCGLQSQLYGHLTGFGLQDFDVLARQYFPSLLHRSCLLQLRDSRVCVQVPERSERGSVHRSVWREWRWEDRSCPHRPAVRGTRTRSKS
jgi:hypothetical protein